MYGSLEAFYFRLLSRDVMYIMCNHESVCLTSDVESLLAQEFSRKMDCLPLIEDMVPLVLRREMTHTASWENDLPHVSGNESLCLLRFTDFSRLMLHETGIFRRSRLSHQRPPRAINEISRVLMSIFRFVVEWSKS